MEDAATAEIARSQVWQWIRHDAVLADGTGDSRRVTPELVRTIATEELDKVRAEVGNEFFFNHGRPEESRALFEEVALGERFVEFLTLPAYDHLD